METNLYNFLRGIQIQANKAVPGAAPLGNGHNLYISLNPDDLIWLETYLRNPGTVIEFRSRETGRMITFDTGVVRMSEDFETPLPELTATHEPELEKHFAIAGNPQEVFALLYEAMTLNPLLAQVMISAARAYLESSPMCRACSQRHPGQPITDCPDLERPSWEFKERKK